MLTFARFETHIQGELHCVWLAKQKMASLLATNACTFGASKGTQVLSYPFYNVQGWPLPETTEVWLLPSTSGASALTNEQREAPFREISKHIGCLEWPRRIQLSCLTTENLNEAGTAKKTSPGELESGATS